MKRTTTTLRPEVLYDEELEVSEKDFIDTEYKNYVRKFKKKKWLLKVPLTIIAAVSIFLLTSYLLFCIGPFEIIFEAATMTAGAISLIIFCAIALCYPVGIILLGLWIVFELCAKPDDVKSFSDNRAEKIVDKITVDALKKEDSNTLILGGSGLGKARFFWPSPILNFLSGNPVSINKKTYDIEKIWNYDKTQLEHVHDYIQWLFPLNEASGYNPSAPILTEQDIEAIKHSIIIQSNLIQSFRIMLNFYGYELDKTSLTIQQVAHLNWLSSHHNYLRITRILKCLTLCGLQKESFAFYQILVNNKEIQEVVPKITLEFWRNAVQPSSQSKTKEV